MLGELFNNNINKKTTKPEIITFYKIVQSQVLIHLTNFADCIL